MTTQRHNQLCLYFEDHDFAKMCLMQRRLELNPFGDAPVYFKDYDFTDTCLLQKFLKDNYFVDSSFDEEFKKEFDDFKIKKIEFEKLVSTSPSNYGFIDVFVEEKNGNAHIIEVKSDVEVIRKDIFKVLRQLKRYRHLYQKPAKLHLLYDYDENESSYLSYDEKRLFKKNDIYVIDFHEVLDSLKFQEAKRQKEKQEREAERQKEAQEREAEERQKALNERRRKEEEEMQKKKEERRKKQLERQKKRKEMIKKFKAFWRFKDM